MSARYRVRLVEQAVTYLAREMRAQAVKLGPQCLELLLRVSDDCAQPLGGCMGLQTSSDLFGRIASSGFLSIFCVRLSLLAGRVAVLSSASLEAERLAAGVEPRVVREPGAMADECCELEAACEEFIEDDEFLGRAATGGVVRCGLSMMAASYSSPRESRAVAWISCPTRVCCLLLAACCVVLAAAVAVHVRQERVGCSSPARRIVGGRRRRLLADAKPPLTPHHSPAALTWANTLVRPIASSPGA